MKIILLMKKLMNILQNNSSNIINLSSIPSYSYYSDYNSYYYIKEELKKK